VFLDDSGPVIMNSKVGQGVIYKPEGN